jgi:outer membrane protein OmpA-like peptidoglycan-associated protein
MSLVVRTIVGSLLAVVPATMVGVWVAQAEDRLTDAEADPGSQPDVATATASNAEYCNASLKKVLRRVLLSCGLAGGERGCQPVDAKNVATMAGEDFNALFLPLSDRAAIIQYDKNQETLDEADIEVLDRTFTDQGGASWFLVVARASTDGDEEHNSELSRRRAEGVMAHLREKFDDPDLEKEVGLLWLGEEFAQLDADFCSWTRSGKKEECDNKDPNDPKDLEDLGKHLNRSAFVAWIDCRL